MSNLYQTLFELSCQQDVDGVLERTLDLLIEETGAERGFVVRMREGQLDVRAARNLDRKDVGLAVMRPSRTVVRQAVSGGRPVRIGRAQEQAGLASHESVNRYNLQSILAIPLFSGDEVGAVVCVDSTRPDAFSQELEQHLVALTTLLKDVLQGVSSREGLVEENQRLKQQLQGAPRFSPLVGDSPEFVRALETLRRAATADVPVLLLGETGTGKELLAREVHDRSDRAAKPFVTLNCAALPGDLLESELFGHVKGAFTGATKDRPGRFAAAHGGTLFLDEVGEMSPSAQARFLRALEAGEIQRVGEDAPRKVDVRVVAATHRDLRDAQGGFRQDLYYRLSLVTIHVPPLRARREDVGALAEAFCLEAAQKFGREVTGIGPRALALLGRHDWPGNVRELKNAIHRATLFCQGRQIEPQDLPADLGGGRTVSGRVQRVVPTTWDGLLELRNRLIHDLELEFASRLLESTQGNVAQAAKQSGMTRPSLYDLLTRVELDAKSFRR
ncbi:MAG: sigma 54-interacting transcriptional regulator [Planctomycetota bacterium]